MNRNSGPSQRSRRDFAKKFLAGLASAPIAASVINAQTSKQRSRFTDHIPPVTIRGGSLTIEIYHELVDLRKLDPKRRGSGSSSHDYIADGIGSKTQYGQIAKVHVVREYLTQNPRTLKWRGGFRTLDCPALGYFDEKTEARLWLWLKNVPDGPHVIVRGGHPIDGEKLQTLFMTCNEDLDRKVHPDSKRTYTHKLREPGGDYDYGIGEWRIVDKDDKPIPGAGAKGDENYIFMLEFHHGIVSK